MRVYIEQTNQKSILKFVCEEVITAGSYELGKNDIAQISPLAQHLLNFPFIEKVFITANFVAVQKNELVEWEDVAQEIKEIVNEYFSAGNIVKEPQKKEPYTLYAEMTPNPKVMRFVANQVLTEKIIEVKSREFAKEVPVALSLMSNFNFISEVFISENYISVTAGEKIQWQDVALEIRQYLLSYLQQGNPIAKEGYIQPTNEYEEKLKTKEYTSTEKQIQQILEEYVKPAVANDGGNIALLDFDEATKTATMLLQGACSGCPSSTITLKNGIETMLKEMLPNVVEKVEAVNG